MNGGGSILGLLRRGVEPSHAAGACVPAVAAAVLLLVGRTGPREASARPPGGVALSVSAEEGLMRPADGWLRDVDVPRTARVGRATGPFESVAASAGRGADEAGGTAVAPHVTGIVGSSRPRALVGGRVCAAGDVVEGWTVVSIDAAGRRVTLVDGSGRRVEAAVAMPELRR